MAYKGSEVDQGKRNFLKTAGIVGAAATLGIIGAEVGALVKGNIEANSIPTPERNLKTVEELAELLYKDMKGRNNENIKKVLPLIFKLTGSKEFKIPERHIVEIGVRQQDSDNAAVNQYNIYSIRTTNEGTIFLDAQEKPLPSIRDFESKLKLDKLEVLFIFIKTPNSDNKGSDQTMYNYSLGADGKLHNSKNTSPQ